MGYPPQGYPAAVGDNEVYGLLLSGTIAARPAAGIADRYYWATDEHVLYHDTGAAWEKAAVADHLDLDGVTADQHHPQSHHVDHEAGGADALAAPVALAAIPRYTFIVEDEKPNGTDGQDLTDREWNTRDLNTVRVNTIPGASLASNQITLPAGTYDIFASAEAGPSNESKIRLRNITDGADALIGSSGSLNPTYTSTTRSFIIGRFTIADVKVFEVQHYVADMCTGGLSTSAGVPEIYAQVKIEKVG